MNWMDAIFNMFSQQNADTETVWDKRTMSISKPMAASTLTLTMTMTWATIQWEQRMSTTS